MRERERESGDGDEKMDGVVGNDVDSDFDDCCLCSNCSWSFVLSEGKEEGRTH